MVVFKMFAGARNDIPVTFGDGLQCPRSLRIFLGADQVLLVAEVKGFENICYDDARPLLNLIGLTSRISQPFSVL